MNAASANAISFPWATLIPTEPAARSFERIASSIRPAGPRLSRATSSPIRITTTSTMTPKTTRFVDVPTLAARFSPSRCGDLIGRPAVPPAKPVLEKISASIAAANPSVTTARFTPRSRSAGSPITNPTGTAHRPASDQREREAEPHPCEMCPSMKPPMPASDICASDTWPTYPVR